ncbi:MAG: hypothetical protein AAB601_00380 [Patescibacteria group bacterium]
MVFVFIFPALVKARDARRKFEITNIGRFIIASCPLPDTGPGDYDLSPLIDELRVKYPQYAGGMTSKPRDPLRGTEEETFYRYVVTGDTPRKCALYANLENKEEPVTIHSLTAPAAGGGTGVLETASPGWNGSIKYFQVSN